MRVDRAVAASIKQMLEERGWIDIPSNGESMFPLIRTGNLCRFVPYREDAARIGDILLFVTDDGVLTGHRYIGRCSFRGEVYYRCKGDSNPSEDPPVAASQIVGQLVSIRNGFGRMRTDSVALRLWARTMTRMPFVSRWIRYYLRAKRKIKRGNGRTWAV